MTDTQQPPNNVQTKRRFGSWERTILGLDQLRAGAGVIGLLGFFLFMVVSILFLVTENYFFSMLFISMAVMSYQSGLDLVKVLLSSFTIFFSTKHLLPKADFMQETLAQVKRTFNLRRNSTGEIELGPVPKGAPIRLPNNPLVQDLQRLTAEQKEYDYAEYVAHSYYIECHALYNYSYNNLEFVSNAMPLFGLMGTVLGLIGMFDSLGANVTVEALTPQLALALKTTLYGAMYSCIFKIIAIRFEQRMKSLEYDYETFCQALRVLVDNKNRILVEA